MRISIVPAEMTSIQDKIIGDLNMNQVILLSTPLIFTILVYLFIPPFSKLSLLKMIVCSISIISLAILSIKIDGKILLEHLKILISFFNRPRIYLNTISEIQPDIGISIENEIENNIITPPEILDREKIFNLKKKDKLIFNLNKKGDLDAKVLRTI
jgi:hypothetical protein